MNIEGPDHVAREPTRPGRPDADRTGARAVSRPVRPVRLLAGVDAEARLLDRV